MYICMLVNLKCLMLNYIQNFPVREKYISNRSEMIYNQSLRLIVILGLPDKLRAVNFIDLSFKRKKNI